MQSILDLDQRIAATERALVQLRHERVAILRGTALPSSVELVHNKLIRTVDVLVAGVRRAIVRVDTRPVGTEYFPGVRLSSGSGYSTEDLREAVWVALLAAGFRFDGDQVEGVAVAKCRADGCTRPALDDVPLCMECLDARCGNVAAGLTLIPGGLR